MRFLFKDDKLRTSVKVRCSVPYTLVLYLYIYICITLSSDILIFRRTTTTTITRTIRDSYTVPNALHKSNTWNLSSAYHAWSLICSTLLVNNIFLLDQRRRTYAACRCGYCGGLGIVEYRNWSFGRPHFAYILSRVWAVWYNTSLQ